MSPFLAIALGAKKERQLGHAWGNVVNSDLRRHDELFIELGQLCSRVHSVGLIS